MPADRTSLVDKNLPANAGDMVSIPGPGRPHMLTAPGLWGFCRPCPALRAPAVEEGGGEVAGEVGVLTGSGRAGRKWGAGEAAWPRVHRHFLKLVAFLFGF